MGTRAAGFAPASALWHKNFVPASWLQLSLKAPPSALDVISNFLVERGSPGVVLEGGGVRAFFPYPRERAPLGREIRRFLKELREIYPTLGAPPLRWRVLSDRNWHSSWKRFFPLQRVGQALWIAPPWRHPPRSLKRTVIVIEPGMAFGTGTHPTTRSCLEFLEEAVALLSSQEITALDFGTGSGILAIALAKMGVREVWALDHDPVALKAAEANVRRNRVAGAVRLSQATLSRVEGPFAIIVANLIAETIMEFSSALKKRVAPGGYLILSGILRPKQSQLMRHFPARSFELVRQRRRKGWTTLLLRKRD